MNTDVDEVEYITVGVGELRITNTSDGNGNDERNWFGVRDLQQLFHYLSQFKYFEMLFTN